MGFVKATNNKKKYLSITWVVRSTRRCNEAVGVVVGAVEVVSLGVDAHAPLSGSKY